MTADSLRVACPLCRAGPGFNCCNTATRMPFAGIVHRERHAAASEPPDFPQYRRADIASCPRCGSDLINDGIAGYWCSGCRENISAKEAIVLDDGERADDY